MAMRRVLLLVMLVGIAGVRSAEVVGEGARPNGVEEMRFLRAAGDGDVAVLRTLLESGQTYVNRYGETQPATALVMVQGPILRQPLHFAALQNRAEAVKYLVEHGAQVDARERFGVTPLHYASMNGHVEAAAALLENGADINAQNHNHWTPLHYAARHGRLEAIRFLMAHGARDDMVNRRENLTPMGLAERFDKGEAATLLRELSAAKRAMPERRMG